MNLNIAYEIWKASGDYSLSQSSLRKYKFTHDHFLLDAYLKMRVFLAVQFTSGTMVKMITDHCNDASNFAKVEDYQPMIELLKAVDRLIDIMNGKRSKARNAELIDHPRHAYIEELFGILRLFEEWRVEAGKNKSRFITYQTYEDLKWMVLGLAATAGLYLKEDRSLAMHQGRSGSDCCEHFFSRMRSRNSNPNAQQAREMASNVSSNLGMLGDIVREVGGNSSSAPTEAVLGQELMMPLEQNANDRKRKRAT